MRRSSGHSLLSLAVLSLLLSLPPSASTSPRGLTSRRQLHSTEEHAALQWQPHNAAFDAGFLQLLLRGIFDLITFFDQQKQQQQQQEREGLKGEFRIVGGSDAGANSFPFVASLRDTLGRHICGGSLIHRQALLTAAHCTVERFSEVHIGRQSRSDGSFLVRQCREIHVNPRWSGRHEEKPPGPEDQRGDLALCILNEPVVTTFPPQLPPKGLQIPVQEVPLTAIGLGLTTEGGELADTLQEVTVFSQGLEPCKQAYGRSVIDGSQICAGVVGGGKDACQGDSGGPLLALGESRSNSTRPLLVGVVSYGNGCGRANFPGVYTSVAYYREWIDEQLQESLGSGLPTAPQVSFELPESMKAQPTRLFGGLQGIGLQGIFGNLLSRGGER